MSNELILIINLVVIYGMTLIFYLLYGKRGLFCWNIIATLTANIEVMLLIRAFGMEQTLGNILFASTFLTTDILSENHGKTNASFAVKTGIAASLAFIIISRFWLIFTPSENDIINGALRTVFSNTPRIMFAGFIVYAFVQYIDVFLYHVFWKLTTKLSGDEKKFLWLRNNFSTMISQFINAVLFNIIAFAGSYNFKTLLEIIISTYIIYIFTSLLDTPVLYFARKYKNNN